MSPNKSILIIESDANVGRSLAGILTHLCFSVALTNNTCEALERLRARKFDLICTDIASPDIDPDSLLSQVQKYRPQIPILVITGYASVDDYFKSLSPNAWSCLLKPVDPCILIDRINEIFQLGME